MDRSRRAESSTTPESPASEVVDVEALFEGHWSTALRIARAHVGDSEAAEDIASEAVLRIIEAIRSGGGPSDNPAGYLHATVRNLGRRHLGRKRTDLSIDHATEVTAHSRDLDDLRALRTAFCTLRDEWRSILWSTEVEGRTVTDVAQAWGISPNAVAALSYRARSALRDAFVEHAAVGDPHPT